MTATLSDEKTRKRELRGLLECCGVFGLRHGLIITFDTEEELEVDGVKVTIMPLYLWLLADTVKDE